MAENDSAVQQVEKQAPQQPAAATAEVPQRKYRPRTAAPRQGFEGQPKAEVAPTPPKASQMKHNSDILLFGKYNYDVQVSDPSLKSYISLTPLKYPSTFRRFSQADFSKANINIVERLINSFMRGGTGKKIGGHVIRTEGRLQGKKIKVMHIVEKAFENVQRQSGRNPLQVYIEALQNAAPIEYTTRIRYGGMVANIAVDVSASKRLDMALRNMVHATIIGAFSNKRTMVDVLTNELMLASKNDINSYAIKRKNEIERMARSAR
jgi:small subunit ribosomal protein S7